MQLSAKQMLIPGSTYRFITQWMKYVPRVFITPVFLGGSALGMVILRRSSFDGAHVDMGHLVAVSALGGCLFEIIYEAPRAFISSIMCAHCFGERMDSDSEDSVE
ncbi:hypothetical protein BDZ89DRAFT_1075436 [Hymenopellis radicata]|nr:hypothetical protein BDZ89DRAFT_1075436 [Hymenopellis radicata]